MASDPQTRAAEYLSAQQLDGFDEIDPEDVITGAVVVFKVERLDEKGAAIVVAADVDWVTIIGMLRAAEAIQLQVDG